MHAVSPRQGGVLLCVFCKRAPFLSLTVHPKLYVSLPAWPNTRLV